MEYDGYGILLEMFYQIFSSNLILLAQNHVKVFLSIPIIRRKGALFTLRFCGDNFFSEAKPNGYLMDAPRSLGFVTAMKNKFEKNKAIFEKNKLYAKM